MTLAEVTRSCSATIALELLREMAPSRSSSTKISNSRSRLVSD
ncbi:hypothetical protein XOCgx_4001 [Xanthomonas oryzae pv. oryzicola]|nr:hypothetical protein XOCgx_4001 [Xanthomonas oryzae pv. oryzicola]